MKKDAWDHPIYSVGDEVVISASGWGFGSDDKGTRVIIEEVIPNSYGKNKTGYKVSKYGDKTGAGPSFTLIEEVPKNTHDKEDNPNIKIIQTFVPSWAKWMAMDANGQWRVYNNKPNSGTKQWIGKGGKKVICGKCNPGDIEVDWKETLHEV